MDSLYIRVKFADIGERSEESSKICRWRSLNLTSSGDLNREVLCLFLYSTRSTEEKKGLIVGERKTKDVKNVFGKRGK